MLASILIKEKSVRSEERADFSGKFVIF